MVGRIESEIERQAEAMLDALDGRYLRSAMTVEEYAEQVRAIERWTQEAFAACPVRW